ncbi:MAG: hypothetical protein IPK80_21510 [Nannocystis sp.]|nr:hypothetical protein [Nannocystis sp.]
MRWIESGLIAAVLGSGGLTAPSVEAAELALVWSAPLGCPEGQVVRAAALALVREAEGAAEGASRRGGAISAEGDVSPRSEGGFTLRLRVRGAGADGERVLVGESCEAVSETAALLLAIAIDRGVLGGPGGADERGDGGGRGDEARPGRADEARAGTGAGQGAPGEEAGAGDGAVLVEDSPLAEAGEGGSVDTRGEGVTREVRDDRAKLSVGLRGRGGVGIGLLEGAVGMGGIGALVGGRRWLIELFWGGSGPKTVFSANNPAVGGRFWAGSGGLRGCGVLRLWESEARRLGLSAPLCGVVELGAVRGSGIGALTPRQASALWAGIGGSGALRLGIGDVVGLWLEAEAVASLLRPGFRTEPSGAFWRVGAVGGRFGVGVELRWAVRAGGERR